MKITFCSLFTACLLFAVAAHAQNTAPTASAVSITGTAEVGYLLTGNYTYSDADGDLEGVSTFRWLRDDVAITGATAQTYTLVGADEATMIKFEVTPVALRGVTPGVPVESAEVGPVLPANFADDWTQRPPDPHPAARAYHAMAYLGHDQVLMFGGWDGSDNSDETWVYDLSDNTWTQKDPTMKPSERRAHAMAYLGDDQVLMFGGWDGSINNDETWVYDLSENTWTQKSPSTKPSARSDMDMAYIGVGQVLLFGGDDGSPDDETWIYDLGTNTWIQQSPSSKPSARVAHAVAYISGGQVLLFGGDDGSPDDETWVYDLGADTWTQQAPSSSNPSARTSHSMAYIGGDQVLLFGGRDGSNNNDETWIYDLGEISWTFDANTTQPSARYDHRLSETSMDGSNLLVLFGGEEASGYDDETWIFGGGDYPVPVELSPLSDAQPKTFQLFTNYPNPFNPDTWINYQLPQAGPVTMKIYNISGQLIKTLVDEEQTAGAYSVTWDGLDLSGSPAASGVYFCQLRSAQAVETIKMILIR